MTMPPAAAPGRFTVVGDHAQRTPRAKALNRKALIGAPATSAWSATTTGTWSAPLGTNSISMPSSRK